MRWEFFFISYDHLLPWLESGSVIMPVFFLSVVLRMELRWISLGLGAACLLLLGGGPSRHFKTASRCTKLTYCR
jgi:hypothetical protein